MTSPWKLLRSFPVVAVFLVACSGSHTDGEAAQTFSSEVLFDPVPTTAVTYSNCSNPPLAPTPVQAIIPFPFDGLFSGFSAPTLNIPNPGHIPTVDQINQLDGFSTVSNVFFDVAGYLDYTTVPANLVVINGNTGATLTYGVDYTIQPEIATAQNPLTCEYTPIETQRSRVLIELLKPLSPATKYLVAVTNGIKTTDGGGVIPSPEFTITSSSTPVSQQSNPYLSNFNPNTTEGATALATLEALRSQLIQPVVAGISQIASIPSDKIVLAWSFTTQSEGLSLAALAATAAPDTAYAGTNPVLAGGIAALPTTLTTDGLGQGFPPGADIYAGALVVPYYLGNSGGNPFSTAPVTSYWQADPTKPNINPNLNPLDPAQPHFLGQVPCAAFATGATVNGVVVGPSASTTVCYPIPQKKSDEIIPLLVTIPNAASGQTMPANGWPVVIFQHGITRQRTDALPVAPAFAKAGMATVAIDMPLHGVTDTDPNPLTNPFYHNQIFTLPPFSGTPAPSLVTGERTFDLTLPVGDPSDPTGCTSAVPPTGTVDPSGAFFINLTSLLTSRDNLRQAEADLLTLRASLDNLSAFLQNATAGAVKLDTSQVGFSSISLGSIVGIPYLANDTKVGAASLAVGGGGIAKLVDTSGDYGIVISLGLACKTNTIITPAGTTTQPGPGIQEGSDDYETFLRFTQTALDDGDPLNYATAAAKNHPIHFMEMVGGGNDPADPTYPVFTSDRVVPNNTPSTCPATLDPTSITMTTDPTYNPSSGKPPTGLYQACFPVNPPNVPLNNVHSDVVIQGSFDAGTDPLVAQMGLTPLGPFLDMTALPGSINTGGSYVVKFGQGFHSSYLSPGNPDLNFATDPTALLVTIEMQNEAANFLASKGTCLPIGTTCAP